MKNGHLESSMKICDSLQDIFLFKTMINSRTIDGNPDTCQGAEEVQQPIVIVAHFRQIPVCAEVLDCLVAAVRIV